MHGWSLRHLEWKASLFQGTELVSWRLDCRARLQGAGNDFLQNVTCFGCGEKGHFKDKCPKAGNQQNDGARGRAYVVVENPQQNPNVVTDLLPTRLGSFDVIIGMDWLAYHRALIDCYEKIVRIPLSNGKILEVQGERPEKDLGLLACIKASEKKLDDIRVVRDFLEVFPDDLLGLPLVREIEFHIDLIPGASPVVRSPYRLAPSEMLELSNQLKELQEKGFIRPSQYHGEAPVPLCPDESASMRLCVLFIKYRIFARIIHQLSVREEGYTETALEPVKGNLSFTVMPIWTVNAPAIFYGINEPRIEKPLFGQICNFVIDDILSIRVRKRAHEAFMKTIFGLTQEGEVVESVKNWKDPESFQLKFVISRIGGYYEALPDGPDDFVVYCDASKQGFGCVLMQRGKVIAYASRQLKKHENNYTTHDLELGAVFIFDPEDLNMPPMAVDQVLSDYECEIKYHPGKANVVADALSRKERLKPRRQRDDGEIYFFDRIWIPSVGGVRKLIMDEAHTSRYSVHPGADKMYYDLRDLYWMTWYESDMLSTLADVLRASRLKSNIRNPQDFFNNQNFLEWIWGNDNAGLYHKVA
ncbi:putative reverse transcriptase domain-containing protein [Tanacetum coccineum]